MRHTLPESSRHLPSATVYVAADAPMRRRVAADLAVLAHPVYEFDSAGPLFDALPDFPCGCLLLGCEAPDATARVLEVLRGRAPDLATVVLSARYDAPTAVELMRAGAADFLPDPPPRDKLVAAARDAILASEAAAAHSRRRRDARRRMSRLTPRRREVLTLALASLTSTEIAERLGLSPRTVEHHRSAALDVLGVASLVEAATVLAFTGDI
jgi:FixJ family two-component response regulator